MLIFTLDSLDDPDGGTAQKIDMSCFQNWFRPALLRWLQMSRIKTTLLLKKAVEVDQMKSVDEIVKHTSSAVDTMGCLDGISCFYLILFISFIFFLNVT